MVGSKEHHVTSILFPATDLAPCIVVETTLTFSVLCLSSIDLCSLPHNTLLLVSHLFASIPCWSLFYLILCYPSLFTVDEICVFS